MTGFDILRPPIGETMFNQAGVINEVWNKFFTEIVGIEQFRNLEGIVANHVLVGYDISSTDYVAATSGWRIASDEGTGVAEFNIPIVSYANITGTKPPINADATETVIAGGIVTTGTVTLLQGGTVAAGITGDTSGDSAVRFWAGSTFANRASAPFRVLQDGSVTATNLTIGAGSSYAGSAISTSYTAAKCTDASADQTSTVIGAGLVTTGTLQVAQGGTVSAGITGNTSGDTAVRFWAGSTFVNRASAPFVVLQNGVTYMTAAVLGNSVALTASSSSLTVTGGSGLGNKLEFGSGGGSISGTSGNVGLVSTGSGWIYFNTASTSIRYESSSFRPVINNTVSLGSVSYRFNTGYFSTVNAPTGTITTVNSTTVNGTTIGTNLVSGTSLVIAGSTSVTITTGSWSTTQQSGAFRPVSNNLLNLGYTNYRWNRLYVSGVTVGTTPVHDEIDDLAALHSIKVDKNGNMDILTLPKRVVSYKEAKDYLRKERGEKVSNEELDKALSSYEDSAHLLGVDLGNFVNLIEGAVRQLDRESGAVYDQAFIWLGDIEKRLKKLEETN